MEIQYQNYKGKQRSLAWPGAAKACHKLINIFPGTTFVIRAPSCRVDTMTPLGPNKVLVEFRGLGLKADTPDERAERLKSHNELWGPLGVNIHEDLLCAELQTKAMQGGVEDTFLLHGREEGMNPHDEVPLRQYYEEWGKWMGRSASDPAGKTA